MRQRVSIPIISFEQACEFLLAGEVVALPTETVYGLAARADRAESIQKIFEAKGRPQTNPLIVHAKDKAGARKPVSKWPAEAEILANQFWPGPLTMVLTANSKYPENLRAGQKTVAVRVPQHPIFRRILEETKLLLAAPSANRSGHISPTQASHVQRSLQSPLVKGVVDGGRCEVGVESTIINLTGPKPTILRPGLITKSQIEKEIGAVETASVFASQGEALSSPGQLKKHYAPNAKVILFEKEMGDRMLEEAQALKKKNVKFGLLSFQKLGAGADFEKRLSSNSTEVGREIYDLFHEAELAKCAVIFVEQPPLTEEWASVNDRLTRSAGEDS